MKVQQGSDINIKNNKIKFDRVRLFDRLSMLYKLEINVNSENNYLVSHSNTNSIQRQIDVFERYFLYINPNSTILDFGCNHAPDSSMIRETFGLSVKLYGCDFADSGSYKGFHGFAQVDYTRLTDIVKLPYEDQTFDTVIASGVLEHTAMDYESLKELHRVIKDGGHLIITFLPNRTSYTEFIAHLYGEGHVRRYGIKEADTLLKHCGFVSSYAGYHQFIPAQKVQRVFKYLWPLNSTFEKLWPTKYFCSNLMFVAKRCSYM